MGKIELRIEINADLAAQAKASGVSLEAAARANRWAEDNAGAIKLYRQRIKERGVFGEDLRRW